MPTDDTHSDDDSENPLDELTWRERLQPYRNRSPIVQIIWAVSCPVVWFGMYALVVHATGWVDLVAQESTDGILARRNAAAVAFAITGVYIGLTELRAFGGPMINVLYAPLLISLDFISPAAFTLFQTTPDLVYQRVDRWIHPVALWDMLVVLMAAFLPYIFIKVYWERAISEEWRERHMPHAWREVFKDEPDESSAQSSTEETPTD